MDSKIVVKIKFGEDTRRISVDLPLNIKQLFGIIQELFQTLEGPYTVKYVDEDNDNITISSDLELREALNVAKQQGNILRLFIFDQKKSTASAPSKPAEEPRTEQQQAPPVFPFGNLFNDPTLFSQLFANPQLFTLVPQVLNTFTANPQLWNTVPQLLQSLVNQLNTSNNNANNNNNGTNLPQEVNELLQAFGLANNEAVKDLLNNALSNPFVKDLLPQLAARLNAFRPPQSTSSTSTPVTSPVVHFGVTCDGCEKHPITGIRYKCAVCPDYDLCEACEAKKTTIHPEHAFNKIDAPASCPFGFFASGHPCRSAAAAAPQEESTQQQSGAHPGVYCDVCEKNIVGIRYKCNECANYDLCESCEVKKDFHHPGHSFLKIDKPAMRLRCPAFGHPRPWRHHGWYQQQQQPGQVVHYGIRCDNCNQCPIVGARFKCNTCADYDLCETCEAKKVHSEHQLTKHTQPISRWGGGCHGGRRFNCGNANASTNNNNATPNYYGGGWGRCGRWARMAQQQQQTSTPGAPTPARHLARFVSDVTIPDGSIMEPGQKFVKIWRMRNEGSAAWEDNTCLVFVGGDTLSSVDTVVVPVNVQPGQEVDLTIDMTAPSKPGRYVGYYRLQVPDGTRFGQRVWVDIFVNNAPVSAPAPTPAVVETPAPSPAPVVEEKKVEQQQQKEDTTPALQPAPAIPPPSSPVEAEIPVPTPSAPALEEEEKDSSEMTQLIEMGFADRELNKTLLAKHNNNMLRTIQELLQL